MVEIVSLLIFLAALLALFVPVLRLLAGLVLAVLALALPVLLVVDLINGGPVLERIIQALLSLFLALYAGIRVLAERSIDD